MVPGFYEAAGTAYRKEYHGSYSHSSTAETLREQHGKVPVQMTLYITPMPEHKP
jgi:hypothetical protein